MSNSTKSHKETALDAIAEFTGMTQNELNSLSDKPVDKLLSIAIITKMLQSVFPQDSLKRIAQSFTEKSFEELNEITQKLTGIAAETEHDQHDRPNTEIDRTGTDKAYQRG